MRGTSDGGTTERWGKWWVTALLGLAGVAFLSFFVHWYETVVFPDRGLSVQQVIVNGLAPFVLFMVLALLLPLNAALRRWLPALQLGRRELTVITSLWLLTSAICFTWLVTPILHTAGEFNNPGNAAALAQSSEVRQALDARLFLSEEAATEYFYGWSEGAHHVPFGRIPWRKWAAPLAYWLPFMALIAVFSLALVRMVDRQWARHELLTYPLAEFADALLSRREGMKWPHLFYDPVFWCGFAAIGLIYLINGISLWMPQMIRVPLDFRHTDLIKEFPFLTNYCGREAYSLFRGMVYPAVVAVAVLLPTEISFTSWAGWVLTILGTGVYFLATGDAIGASETSIVNFGSTVALAGMLAYIGRREYATILRHACRLRLPDDPGLRRAVAACRTFLAAFTGLVAMLMIAGCDWLLALILVASFALVVLLAARMTAEMGIPWLPQLNGMAYGLPLKLLGATALGPKGLALFCVIGSLLGANMTNSLAAQETTVARLRDRVGSRLRRFDALIVIGVCLAIAASVAFTLWNNYSFGAQRETSLSTSLRSELGTAAKETDRMRTQGVLAETEGLHGWRQLAHAELPAGFWTLFLLGLVMVGGCAFMRLRHTWWPFHPLPLLFFGTWTMSRLYLSFLIGWAIKVALLKTGGGKVFTRLKPLFIGAVLGQVAVAGFWIVVNVVYYLVNGSIEPDKAVRIFI